MDLLPEEEAAWRMSLEAALDGECPGPALVWMMIVTIGRLGGLVEVVEIGNPPDHTLN